MTSEQKARMKAIEKELRFGDMTNYDEWVTLDNMEHAEYAQEQLPELECYFNTYIKGRSISEIEPERWDFYSDWHKDVFRVRPHQTKRLGM